MDLRKHLYLVAIIGITSAGSVAAGGIAHWVDENGVTHFGNPQFAPAGEGVLIEVTATNIMDVPVAPPTRGPWHVERGYDQTARQAQQTWLAGLRQHTKPQQT